MSEPMLPDLAGGSLPDPGTPGGVAAPEFIASLLVDGDDDLAAWAISHALDEMPRSAVYDDVVQRAMEIVGSRWESGQWLISQEHLATVALMAALARLRPGDGTTTRIGPVAVLAAPAGEEHVTGLVCLAQILEERGWRAENLGANVPAVDLQRFVGSQVVDLIALSIATKDRLPALRRTIDLLRREPSIGRTVPIIVGGHGIAESDPAALDVDLVSSTLVEAERFIVSLGERLLQPPP